MVKVSRVYQFSLIALLILVFIVYSGVRQGSLLTRLQVWRQVPLQVRNQIIDVLITHNSILVPSRLRLRLMKEMYPRVLPPRVSASFFPHVKNFAAFSIDRSEYSPDDQYYLWGFSAGSPITNSELLPGIWILNMQTGELNRIMYAPQKPIHVSRLHSWLDSNRLAFTDQEKTNHYLIYDLRAKQLLPATHVELLPSIKENRFYYEPQTGIAFSAPFRVYPSDSTTYQNFGPDLCDATLTVTDEPADFTLPYQYGLSGRLFMLRGRLFDLYYSYKQRRYKVFHHTQDTGLRDACITSEELEKVVESIQLMPPS